MGRNRDQHGQENGRRSGAAKWEGDKRPGRGYVERGLCQKDPARVHWETLRRRIFRPAERVLRPPQNAAADRRPALDEGRRMTVSCGLPTVKRALLGANSLLLPLAR
ncbi:uncharacterized protein LOC129199414 isoform X1 [Grus americana]|uniref:uncharacterized protein LOC129199414 isoform X1 n=1 Tax=Grus americana TaxID=9117 RepID=UPI002408354C|nr:uncharacterized protein LOC129199414 isoform X1 [Grus americana]